MRILVAESYFLVVQMIRLALTEAGHHVVATAASAEEAIRLAGQYQPDLALVDVDLAHDTTGIEAAHRIHAGSGVPSLLLASDRAAARAGRGAALGCLQKPYSAPQLVAAIGVVEHLLKGQTPATAPPGLELF